jgi:Tol biopolymer transport system component
MNRVLGGILVGTVAVVMALIVVVGSIIVNADWELDIYGDPSPDPKQVLSPTWSPDGKRLAFVSNLDSDGSSGADDAVWSPDGTRIAFLSGQQSAATLCLVRPDGSGRRAVHLVRRPN